MGSSSGAVAIQIKPRDVTPQQKEEKRGEDEIAEADSRQRPSAVDEATGGKLSGDGAPLAVRNPDALNLEGVAE